MSGSAARNLLFIIADQHNRYASGTYGSTVIDTPNLDALAARGTTFNAAYCASPMCVPSRAAMMTGQPVHDIGAWDNAHPYDGEPPGWAHALRATGVRTTVIGKMHFRNAEDDTGFDEVLLPLDVSAGVGDLYSLVRDRMPARPALADLVREAGPGESPYAKYDITVMESACDWLRNAPRDQRWALTVSFATPHHPLLAPQEFWDLYADVDIALPPEPPAGEHSYLTELRRVMGVETPFGTEEIRKARRAYYALCTFADHMIGQVLEELREAGLEDNTIVIYTSDHGCSLGERGLWWKHHMYEESVGVPLIVAGPSVTSGDRVDRAVSQTALYNTILRALDVPEDNDGRPRSLLDHEGRDEIGATAFAEYHGLGASSAAFMIRRGPAKYIYYQTLPAQLFDLDSDPLELNDLASDPECKELLLDLDQELRRFVDPEAADRAARSAQEFLIQKHGGREAILGAGFQIPFTPVHGEDA